MIYLWFAVVILICLDMYLCYMRNVDELVLTYIMHTCTLSRTHLIQDSSSCLRFSVSHRNRGGPFNISIHNNDIMHLNLAVLGSGKNVYFRELAESVPCLMPSLQRLMPERRRIRDSSSEQREIMRSNSGVRRPRLGAGGHEQHRPREVLGLSCRTLAPIRNRLETALGCLFAGSDGKHLLQNFSWLKG